MICVAHLLSGKTNSLDKLTNAFISREFMEYLKNHKWILILLMIFLAFKLINKICSLFSKTNRKREFIKLSDQHTEADIENLKQEKAKQFLYDLSSGIPECYSENDKKTNILFNFYAIFNDYNFCNQLGIPNIITPTLINLFTKERDNKSQDDYKSRKKEYEIFSSGISSCTDYTIKKVLTLTAIVLVSIGLYKCFNTAKSGVLPEYLQGNTTLLIILTIALVLITLGLMVQKNLRLNVQLVLSLVV
jgi:hypothetical protein